MFVPRGCRVKLLPKQKRNRGRATSVSPHCLRNPLAWGLYPLAMGSINRSFNKKRRNILPPVPKHLKTSADRTGKDYRELHEWIDDPDITIKAQRHDITKIYEYGAIFEEKYGKEGVQEYIAHIHDDIHTKFNHILRDFEKAMTDALIYFGVKKENM
ncbi:metal dependent phosphohydrolase [Candidatus Omnitrophus magneticus]|uniref:Metal dependent phosphohydrolase n=1 Tax=Candidatus Omnitrophus magneticus TaxID=1609969 RepID=A0A0F0CK73_9BACT|nr:metal dependent phosphohydrolase [Candidatus Omnitrophus magneticus]